MFPIIPIVAIAAIVGGTGALTWYSTLSPEEKEEADENANKYAKKWFKKKLDELDEPEAHQVIEQVRDDME